MEPYQLLIVLGFVFLILEIFIPAFMVASVAVGFFLAALVSFLGGSGEWQIFFFSLGVLLTFFGIRPMMGKVGYGKGGTLKTNQEALLGRRGRVTESIDNVLNTGSVRVDGDVWKAKSLDDTSIEEGALVEVVALESIVLTVKKI
jgi:membrane protein implicated in regulation of membrane protease activity